jgi:hypothetical protein
MESTQPPTQNQPQIANPVSPQPEIPLPSSQTPPIPEEQPPIPPVPLKRPPILKMLLIVFFLVVLMSAGYYGFLYYKEVSKPSPTPTTESTPTATTDPTADWKIYTNEDYAFQFKYPSSLTIDFKNQGFISGSDYYGKRDFNFLIYNPNIEPSVLSATGDVTPESKYAYDGYNFAIFSGESAKNHLKNLEDTINGTHSPAIEKKSVLIAGQEYPLYYIPPSDQPNTDKTSYWFISFPLKENTMIISGNYDQNILIQILSTFKFVDQGTYISSWETYRIDRLGVEFKLPPYLSNKIPFPEEVKGEKGTIICANFIIKTSSLIKTIKAGGAGCPVDFLSVGGTSLDFEAGRGGMFTDLQGYTNKNGKYFARLNLNREVEIPSDLIKEIINPNGVKILIVEGKNSGPENLPVTGTPGEGRLGALINLNSTNLTYSGFVVEIKLTDQLNKQLFDQILSTFKFTN